MYRARRRHFLLAAAALTASGYLRAAPKSAAVRRIGYLTLDSPYEGEAEAFKAALQEAGYGEEAKRLVIEYRHAKRDMDSLPALAADLVRRKVDLIIGFSNDEIKAAMQATRTIPIVMLWPGSPVEDRLVESLSRPGGNVTGTTYFEPEMLTRSFHLLMEARPTIRRIAVLWNSSPGYLTYKIGMRRVDELSAARGVQLEYYDVHRTEELTPNLQRIASSRADALLKT